MISKKIIFLNGPPRSGKDTAADLIYANVASVWRYKMAFPLKESCHKLLGLQGSLEELEPLKEQEIEYEPAWGKFPSKMTLRQFYIYMSESVMKPLFGNDIFGRIAIQHIKNSTSDIVTISDSGFKEEALPIIEAFGEENCYLIKIHREGATFKNDSRSYIDLPIKSLDLMNDTSIKKFEKLLLVNIKQLCPTLQISK